MKIWLIEDDPLQAEHIGRELRRGLRGRSEVEVRRIATEQQFGSRFEEIAASQPDVIVIDVLLRWTDPDPDMRPDPDEQMEEGRVFSAGFRCLDRLAADPRTCDVPLLIYTILDRGDVEERLARAPANTSYVRKESNPTNLIREVQRAVRAG